MIFFNFYCKIIIDLQNIVKRQGGPLFPLPVFPNGSILHNGCAIAYLGFEILNPPSPLALASDFSVVLRILLGQMSHICNVRII